MDLQYNAWTYSQSRKLYMNFLNSGSESSHHSNLPYSLAFSTWEFSCSCNLLSRSRRPKEQEKSMLVSITVQQMVRAAFNLKVILKKTFSVSEVKTTVNWLALIMVCFQKTRPWKITQDWQLLLEHYNAQYHSSAQTLVHDSLMLDVAYSPKKEYKHWSHNC